MHYPAYPTDAPALTVKAWMAETAAVMASRPGAEDKGTYKYGDITGFILHKRCGGAVEI